MPIQPSIAGAASGALRLRRLPDRVAATRAIDVAEAFRDLPGLTLLESARPGRNARWTYLTADPVAVLDGPAAGPDPFAVARRLLARLEPRRSSRPMRHASWAGWLATSAMTWGMPSSGCRRWLSTTRACRRCTSGCTTGSWPGIGAPVTPGSPVGRSMATGAASLGD